MARTVVSKSYLGRYGKQVVGTTPGKLGRLVGAKTGSNGVTIRKGRR